MPSVNAVCCFFASLRKGTSQCRMQPNFATCWEVNQICKRMSKIGGVLSSKNCGAKTPYSVTVFNSTQLRQMSKNRIGVFYPTAVNACYDYDASGLWWRRISNVNHTIRIKSLLSLGPKKFYVGSDIASGGLKCRTSLIATFSSFQ